MIGRNDGWGGNGDSDTLPRIMNVSRSNAFITPPSSLAQIYRCCNTHPGRSQRYSRPVPWDIHLGHSREGLTQCHNILHLLQYLVPNGQHKTPSQPFQNLLQQPAPQNRSPLPQHFVRVVGISLQNDSCGPHVDTYCTLHNVPR